MTDPFFSLVPLTVVDVRLINAAAGQAGQTREDFIAGAAIRLAAAMVEGAPSRATSIQEFMPTI